MTKYLSNILCVVVLILMTGCTDEADNALILQGNGISATIVNDEQTVTRASMVDSPTDRVAMHWTGGDAIGVFADGGANQQYTTTTADISRDSTTAVFKSAGGVPHGTYVAYFPYNANATGNQTELHLFMDATQKYTTHDFIAVPDAQANIMVGQGYGSTVSLRNVMAVLKIGYVPQDSDVVRKVVFRDLSGRPVAGTFSVTLAADGTPSSTFPTTGSNTTLTLDCGDGVDVASTDVTNFFMVVPAREYGKGFQLDFVLASGKTDSRTVGTRVGKTLSRAMAYSVGDVSVVSTSDCTIDFGPRGGKVFDDNVMAMVLSVKSIGLCGDGDEYGDYYEFIVKQGIGMTAGQTVVVNRTSEALPYGLVGELMEVTDIGSGHDLWRVRRYPRVEKAFKKLQIGRRTVFTEDGEAPDESGLVNLDLTRHFQGIIPAEGVEGTTITFDGKELNVTGTFAPEQNTTRSAKTSLTLPRIGHNFSWGDHHRVSLGAQASVMLAAGASIADYSIEYLSLSLTPSLKIDFSVQGRIEGVVCDKEFELFTIPFSPVTIGPIVIVPKAKVSAYLKLYGRVELTAQWSYTIGATVGASYSRTYGAGGNPEYGVTGRFINKSDAAPTLGSLIPNFGAQVGLNIDGGLVVDAIGSFYGLVDSKVYLKGGATLYAGAMIGGGGTNYLFTMAPAIEAGVGVLNTRKQIRTLDFAPWWERMAYPWASIYVGDGQYKRLIGDNPVGQSEHVSLPVAAYLQGKIFNNQLIKWDVKYLKPGESESEARDWYDKQATLYEKSPLLEAADIVAGNKDKRLSEVLDFTVTKGNSYLIYLHADKADSSTGFGDKLLPSPASPNYIKVWLKDIEETVDGTTVVHRYLMCLDYNGRAE